MARLARVVVPDAPHHITQRGNHRQQTFFCDADYAAYLEIMAEACAREPVTCLAYCLMPNHVHLILVPSTTAALSRAISQAHRRYTRYVNVIKGWTGHLWQGRFASFPMDEAHLLAAARYVELNPVQGGLAQRARDWRWSSARAHLAGTDDALARVRPLLDLVPDWRGFLAAGDDPKVPDWIDKHLSTGRPLGAPAFVAAAEAKLGRSLRPEKRGPKPARMEFRGQLT